MTEQLAPRRRYRIPAISPKARSRLRNTLAAACYGFTVNVVANQVGLPFALFVAAVGAAIVIYDLWPSQRVMRKLMVSGSVLIVCTLLIFVAPMMFKGRGATLYYEGHKQLDGATVTLGSNPDPKSCMVMHVWATVQPGPPNSFIACGIWMEKPSDATSPTAFGALSDLYIDLAQDVTDSYSCQRLYGTPELPYRVSLKCSGLEKVELARWILPRFQVSPIPTTDTKVRVRFDYGKSRIPEAVFTLRPPNR